MSKKQRKEPHLEVIQMMTRIKLNNESEIERLKTVPGSKKVIAKTKKINEKLEKAISKLRKDKSEKVVQQKIF